VGDDDERPLPAREPAVQVPGQPRDGLHVQVVRGLVEHEHLERAGERGGEGHATPLATGELPHRGLQVQVRQQPVMDVPDVRL